MDDGPEPMKDQKPSKKNLNSADQFNQTHQAEYEDRERMDDDGIDKVNEHNSAYPKMRDEEDRRRSMLEIKTSQANQHYGYDPNCEACIKLKRSATPKKQIKKPQRQMSRKCNCQTKRKTERERTSRVKKRVRFQNKRKPVSKQKTVCNCCRLKDKFTVTEFVPVNSALVLGERKEMSNDKSQDNQDESRGSGSNSVNSLNRPDTSNTSITSYHTFASMDHEPMVPKN